jgi:hypothetical protein
MFRRDLAMCRRDLAMFRRDLVMFRRDLTMFRRDLAMFRRNLSMFRRDLAMFRRDLLMFRRDLVMFRRDLAMFRRDLTMFRRDLAMFRRNLVMFRRDLAMFRRNLIMFRRDLPMFRKTLARISLIEAYSGLSVTADFLLWPASTVPVCLAVLLVTPGAVSSSHRIAPASASSGTLCPSARSLATGGVLYLSASSLNGVETQKMMNVSGSRLYISVNTNRSKQRATLSRV